LDDMNPCTTKSTAPALGVWGLRRSLLLYGVAAALAAVLALAPALAHAQTTSGITTPQNVNHPLDANVKGTIGGGLLGAELGFVIPALAGARDAWAFIVFPVIGAGGGAVAGYFLIDKPNHAEAAVATLVAGMALVVPALVVTLAATAYEPDTEAAMAAAAGPGLVRWSERGVLLAPPGVSAGPTITPQEALRTGARRTSAVQVSVLSGRF
jgi:hypothetical protein